MERWQNCVAVVTGASSGIGFAIVKDLVHAGVITVALGRRKERLDGLRSSLPVEVQFRMHSIKCDVSSIDEVNRTFDWIEQNLGGIDIMINNAGVFKSGKLLTHELSTLQEVMQINVMGVVHCTKRAFESMKKRKINGHIVIMNSIVGHNIIACNSDVEPLFNIYPSSKHALTAMAEVLRQELRDAGTKIKITSISPGVTDTEMLPSAFRAMPKLMSEDISSAVMYAIGTPPHVQIHDIIIKPVGEIF